MEGPQQKQVCQNLPIFKYKNQILKSIQQESAIIISGLTGCGKSTQVPQYLLDNFPKSRIAVCQPRRLAATSLALRVCDQRKSKIGYQVGYQIGLETKRSQKTKIVYMTYGILIQQLLFRDQLDYDFIILDQVHERSLEMDFAFVILKKIINQNIKDAQIKNQPSSKQNKLLSEQNDTSKKQGTEISTTKQANQKNQETTNIKGCSRRLKLIIMSATLNSEQFQRYFAVHKLTKLIIQPDVVIKHESRQVGNRRGNRDNQKKRGNVDYSVILQPKKSLQISYSNIVDFRQGKCIFINQKSNYTVKQYYLEDFLPYFQIKAPQRNYEQRDQIRLQQKDYDWGLKLIQKANRDIQYLRKQAPDSNKQVQEPGDILIFLPGLIEINKMKECLIRSNQSMAQQIVEVHSLFSQELYFKLFQSKVKNKIILATNIGQSSITLPNCKVVIDYCLNRKALKNSKEGISRFSTSIASLSNLIQRKGRVGRVSDGTVYRMITKQEYQKLDQFDVPQIKCVNLSMAILKTKKLQSTSRSHIFSDIYEIFLNVLEPPQVQSIQTAIDSLIHQDALQYIEQKEGKATEEKQSKQNKKNINSGKKYQGQRLKITKVGQFMVTMPCELSISKLILMGIKLGIPSVIIDISAVILSTKSFFCHQQRRANIEEFMHSMIGYDKGDNNDYLLRQRLFDHWRSRFFIPFRDRYRQKSQQKSSSDKNYQETFNRNKQQTSFRIFDFGEQVQYDQNYKIVDKFIRKDQSNDQKQFCKNRGVYPNFMRQLLRMSQTLKIRIEMIGVQKSKLNTFQPEAQLILICLMYAFPDLICEVNFDLKRKQISHILGQKQYFTNKLNIPLFEGFNNKQLQCYLNPQKDYEVQQHENSLMIMSFDHVLKKFLLPKHYAKSPSQNCSLLYKHCKLSKIKYQLDFSLYNGFRNITILNQSINKEILISRDAFVPDKIQNKFLISHNLIQSKGRYMIAANALLSHFELVIISMIVKKDIKVSLHASKEFFGHIQLNQKRFQIPLLLTQAQLALINKLRALSKRKKQEEIASYRQQFDKTQLQILSNLFTLQNRKPMQEQWQELFIEQENQVEQQMFSNLSLEQYHKEKDKQWITIEEAQSKIKGNKGKKYHQRYNDWKKYLFQSTQTQLKLYSTTQAILICGHCNLNGKLVQISSAHQFEFKSGLLKINKFSGSWKCPDSNSDEIDRAGLKLYCTNNHHIGTSINCDYSQIDHKNIHLYTPFNQIYPLSTIQLTDHYYEIINSAKREGLQQLAYQQQKHQEYECKICFSKESYKKIFRRNELQGKREKRINHLRDSLWNTVINHVLSTAHINNKERLRRSVRFD